MSAEALAWALWVDDVVEDSGEHHRAVALLARTALAQSPPPAGREHWTADQAALYSLLRAGDLEAASDLAAETGRGWMGSAERLSYLWADAMHHGGSLRHMNAGIYGKPLTRWLSPTAPSGRTLREWERIGTGVYLAVTDGLDLDAVRWDHEWQRLAMEALRGGDRRAAAEIAELGGAREEVVSQLRRYSYARRL